jgi:CRP-like cAMP-binding protein
VPAEFGPGEPVIRQGDLAEHFFVIESGQLAVMVDGQPRPSLGPGDAFGEIALMRAVPRTASVTAETGVRLWMLDRETFLAAIAGSRRAQTVATRVVDTRLAATQRTRAEERNYRNRRR